MKRTAIILFNLGGPDQQTSVRPFLFNLFNDAAIIRAPQPLRYLIARLISTRRAPIAREIYAKMGGGSPILKNTQAQAEALEKSLNDLPNPQPLTPDRLFKTFIVMRYWHPFADEISQQVKQFAPDEIILLPLYPQFSTTTTDSSLKDWREQARHYNITAPTKIICCYPQENGFIRALADATRAAYDRAKQFGAPRILFSAHGLPEKIIKSGDPYQAQCEMTVQALCGALQIPDLDAVLCFQSRVGPLKWITPATEDEVKKAGAEKKPVVIVPIAFVSDHSETLVELDIEYRHLAQESGVPHYGFVPAVGAAPDFIKGLAKLVHNALIQEKTCVSETGARLCPKDFSGCICNP